MIVDVSSASEGAEYGIMEFSPFGHCIENLPALG